MLGQNKRSDWWGILPGLMMCLCLTMLQVSGATAQDKDRNLPGEREQIPVAQPEQQSGPEQDPEQAEKGKPAKSRVRVDIQGLEGELLENAQAFVELEQKSADPEITDLWIKHLHGLAGEEIKQSLQPFGYYNALVDASLTQDAEGKWLAVYLVTPGLKVKIASLDLQWRGEGSEEPLLLEAAEAFPLQPGVALDHEIYEEAKAVLLKQAHQLGYPDVEAVKARVLVYPEKNSADISLHLDTGTKYYIGEIRLNQDVLEDEFVRRYLVDVKPGDTYSQVNLLEIQQDLIEAGYFSLVNVNPRFRQAEGANVPVDVSLSPAKRQAFSFGLGYDTDIEFNLRMRWNHRRLNKQGHKADALIKLSANESTIRGNYWIPIKDPRTHKLGISSKLETEITDSTERLTWDLEGGYYYTWKDWISKLFTEFKWERFTAGAEPETNTTLLSIGASTERTFVEEGNFPRWAWSLFADLRGSPGWLSSTDYVRTHIKGRVFLPVFSQGRVILRAELGGATVGDFSKYPNSLRFFAGGDQSVRGYDWKSLGPKDEEGEVIGGKEVFTSSVEYDHKLTDTWVAAVFVDAGNAYNDEYEKLFWGAGFGGRYLSPIGSVRLDLAWPMNEDDEDPELSDFRIHFGFEVTL